MGPKPLLARNDCALLSAVPSDLRGSEPFVRFEFGQEAIHVFFGQRPVVCSNETWQVSSLPETRIGNFALTRLRIVDACDIVHATSDEKDSIR